MAPTKVRDIRAFVLLAKTGSMVRAARLLGESSGAISRRIDRLEREVGMLLVHRSTRSMRLTDEGAAYLNTAQQVLDLLDQATVRTEQGIADLTGSLRVWSSPGFGLNILPSLLARMSALHPRLHVETTVSDAQPNFALGTDVAIFPTTRPLRNSALIMRKIMKWTNVFVASPGYLARNPAPARPSQLADHQLILGGEQAREQIEIALLRKGAPKDKREKIVLRPTATSLDINFVRQCCIFGGGVSFLPAFMAADDLKGGRLKTVLEDYESESFSGNLYVLYRKTKTIAPKVKAFLAFLSP